jgi:DNA-binding NarL/FixJ family response regulator
LSDDVTAAAGAGDLPRESPPKRVLLVDDHPIVRQGLRRLLAAEDGLEVCAEAETVHAARQATREHHPDVVVVDISLREGDGIELVKDLRAHHPGLPLLVLSMHDELVYAGRMLAAGANGYIMKHAASEQFVAALRRVLDGGTWVSDAVGARLIGQVVRGSGAETGDPVDRLSNRELQVLQMIGRGLSSRQMAEQLHLSIKTIEAHRQRIRRTLELGTSAQLTQFAADWAARR